MPECFELCVFSAPLAECKFVISTFTSGFIVLLLLLSCDESPPAAAGTWKGLLLVEDVQTCAVVRLLSGKKMTRVYGMAVSYVRHM